MKKDNIDSEDKSTSQSAYCDPVRTARMFLSPTQQSWIRKITTLRFCEIRASCSGNAEYSSRILAHGTVSQGTWFVSLWRITGSTSSGQSNPRRSLKMKILQDVRNTMPIDTVSHPRWIKSLTIIVCDASLSVRPCGKNKYQAYFRTSNKENFIVCLCNMINIYLL